MKKLFYLSIALSLLIMFYSCENTPNLLDNNTQENDEVNSLAKGKAVKNVMADIVYLAIESTPLIINNEVQPLGELELDFRLLNNSYDIEYEVFHPEGVNFVRIKTWCDIIPNGYQWPHDGLLENSGTIWYDESDGCEDGTVPWDGMIIPDGWDSDVYTEPYKIFDQLATTTHPSNDYLDKPDDYGIMIMVESKGKFPTFTYMQSNTFNVFANGLSDAFYVHSVDIVKSKNTIKAKIKVLDDEGSALGGAWVFGYWDGITDYFKGVTDGNGFAEIMGRGQRNNKFSVRSVEKAGLVYNPWLNTSWQWPQEPFGILIK